MFFENHFQDSDNTKETPHEEVSKKTEFNKEDTSEGQKKAPMITKEMLIAEVIQRKPRTIQTLMMIGMGCIGCPSSMMESVEQAAFVHGIDPDVLVEKLNAV